MDAIRALLKQVMTFWAGKDKRFKRNAIIIAAVVLVVVVVSSVLLNQVNYAVLYSGLDANDSAAVLDALKEQKVNFKVSGNSILVPADQADSLRLSLSSEVQKGFNLDILQMAQGLGMTESQQQEYRRRQIQEDIRNSIKTFAGVKDARVAITMPKDSGLVLDRNQTDATAGVILTMQPGVELNNDQVRTIAQFVKNAVPRLKLDNISIMDSMMRNLDGSSEDPGASASDRYALQYDVQSKLRKQIMALLLPVFGIGRVEAQVSVALDFDTQTEDKEIFQPGPDNKNGIVVSIEKLREQIVNGEASPSGEPGTGSNTGAATPTYPVLGTDNGTYEKNAETINYEISSIRSHLEKEKGAIKSLSVSVVIDSTGLKDDYSDNVKNLVATAVGVDKSLISVEYLPMAAVHDEQAAVGEQEKAQEALVLSESNKFLIVVGAVVLVALIAMLLFFAFRRAKEKAVIDQQTAVLTAEAAASEELQQMEEELEAIKIVKESGAKEQIGKLIEKNPDLVANLLRSWLADEQE